MRIVVPKVTDFEVTGDGTAVQWHKAEWQSLSIAGAQSRSYSSKVKTVYSEKGIYFLFDCDDKKLTCTMLRDNQDIYKEDVVEFFLWPCEEQNVYFEYEISPMCVQLSLMVSNSEGRYMGWTPWHYEGDRMIRRATSVRGGQRVPMADVSGWMAEVFMPFALLTGLGNTPPKSGASWRGNMYRIDYDGGEQVLWAWAPEVGRNFHNFKKFGTLVFE